uniref:Uncharacterized protein n=1 Tax=Opuntia streptacantha TaxID=393608 RepID=A0A7C8ZAC4_OPUST
MCTQSRRRVFSSSPKHILQSSPSQLPYKRWGAEKVCFKRSLRHPNIISSLEGEGTISLNNQVAMYQSSSTQCNINFRSHLSYEKQLRQIKKPFSSRSSEA